MSNSDPIVIVGASRTPMGGFQGDFASVQATDLGAAAICGALAGAGLAPEAVEDVYMGCVLPPVRDRLRHVRLRSKPEYPFPLAQRPSTRCVAPA